MTVSYLCRKANPPSGKTRLQGHPTAGEGDISLTDDLFDPSLYADVRRPTAEANHLPSWCYTSEAFFRRERETVFSRVWNFLGRVDLIPDAGDYFTREVAGAPLIILRGSDGNVRAFANSCRHRGARLLAGAGKCEHSISCPYHSWTYALDGKLIGARGMRGVADFDKGDYGLLPVRLETWNGFLFVTLDSDAPDLAFYLGDLPRLLECYDFANMVCTRRQPYSVASNWKLITENSMEDYHTATVHRNSIGAQTIELVSGAGNWDGGFFEAEKSIATLPGETSSLPWIPTLDERARRGTHFIVIYPCTTLACMQDGIFWFEVYPKGPALTELVVGHAFPKTSVARPDFEEIVAKYYYRTDVSIPEDNAIAEVQQVGLDSPLARTGRVSLQETIVHSLANWLLDHVIDGASQSGAANRR